MDLLLLLLFCRVQNLVPVNYNLEIVERVSRWARDNVCISAGLKMPVMF
jgi:hypothetical protein